MKRMIVTLATIIVVVLSLPLMSFGLDFSGYGTATINGVMSPGEWDKATKIDFQANVPTGDGGGTTPATLYVMNDDQNIYFALKIARPSFGYATYFSVDFDNNNDGVAASGDDAVQMVVTAKSTLPAFEDMYRFTCPGQAVGTANCSTKDTATDVTASKGYILPAGVNNGKAGAINNGSFTVIEISHELTTTDTTHDFSLKQGDKVGFNPKLILQSQLNFTKAETQIPVSGTTVGYGQITIASATVTREIDIKPGNSSNTINSKSEGKIPVAILSTVDFDAPASVDRSSITLTFGRTGDEQSLAFCNKDSQDVNGDGLPDLVCHFSTPDAAFQADDTTGILKGQAKDGTLFMGKNSVRLVH